MSTPTPCARASMLTVVVLSVIVPTTALEPTAIKPPKTVPPISLQFVGAKQDAVFRETASGWPVTLRLSSNDELGIGTPSLPPYFPRFQEVGYLIFADPDNCFSFGIDATCGVTDETYVEFTPDLDRAGLPNPHGNADRLIALTTSGGGGSPTVLTFDFDTHLNEKLVPYGPLVGGGDTLEKRCSSVLKFAGVACASDGDCPAGSTCRELPVEADGFGYGADDDLPGLVLLSDTGAGLVLNQNFNPPRIRQARNLAGLLNSVAYDLREGSHRPTILAHMNVPPGRTYTLRDSFDQPIPTPMPRGLFTPVVLADRCVGDPNICQSAPAHLFRIDGGPVVSLTDNELFAFLNERVVTLRAFVVNGTAPSILADLSGDGVIGAKDAALAGYQLLSNEEIIRVVGFYDDNFEVLPMLYDFDGNGDARGLLVAPGGAGQNTPVPD